MSNKYEFGKIISPFSFLIWSSQKQLVPVQAAGVTNLYYLLTGYPVRTGKILSPKS